MGNTARQPTVRSDAMFDEDAVIAILSRHFPGARRDVVRKAAEDVLLLDLLTRDIGLVWEDAMRDGEKMVPMTLSDRRPRRES